MRHSLKRGVLIFLLTQGGFSFESLSWPPRSHAVSILLDLRKNVYRQPVAGIFYRSSDLFDEHLRASVQYSTNRFATAAGRNDITRDDFIFAAGWGFRPGTYVNPYVDLEAGLARYDNEGFEYYDNERFYMAVMAGIESTVIKRNLLGLHAALGYSPPFITTRSSLIYPLSFRAGVSSEVFRFPRMR